MSSISKKIGYALNTVRGVLINAAQGGDFLASGQLKQERLKTCEGCEHFTVLVTPRCNECGCFAQLKTELKASKCPIGKW